MQNSNLPYKQDQFQEKIIALDRGYHLVLAPPGCGKTKILAERVSHAITLGVPLEQMLCLTFTNRAAREMHSRIGMQLSEESEDQLFVGNIHRFCSHFLFHQNIIPKSTTIIDETETVSIIQSLIWRKETGKYNQVKREFFTQVIGMQHLAYQIIQGVPRKYWLYEQLYRDLHLQNYLQRLGLPWNTQNFAAVYQQQIHTDNYYDYRPVNSNLLLGELFELAYAYQKLKEDYHLIDFDDLLLFTYTYASQHTEEIPKYRWIQIDEVQDLSPLQFALVDLFTDNIPDSVTLYLGDEQQAIFSFIGAKTSTLDYLKQRCRNHIHTLQCNYRSPNYLLRLFNEYAENQLLVDEDFLPHAENKKRQPANALVISHCDYDKDEPLMTARIVKQLMQRYPDEKIAILVPWNIHADTISKVFDNNHIRHFKISGEDLFTQPPMQLLCAHLEAVANETNFNAWAKIFYFIQIFNKPSEARAFTYTCRQCAVVPSDFLRYSSSTYLLEMERACQETYIVLDTECTGLDVFQDDIVQISAIKVSRGEIIDCLQLLLTTTRKIPELIDGIENPLHTQYAENPKISREEGLLQLLKFIGNLTLIGHNLTYDLQMIYYNLQRTLPQENHDFKQHHLFDTLKATRILYPRLESYKLQSLVQAFGLQHPSTHIADDDVLATYHLLNHCLEEFTTVKPRHLKFLRTHQIHIQHIQRIYTNIYHQTLSRLYCPNPYRTPVLVNELCRLYAIFIKAGWICHLPKMHYIFRFLRNDVICPSVTPRLIDQINAHLLDLTTYREADLCDSSAIKERIFISTVHKAKGLEFHNVLLYSANEGFYPFFYSQSNEDYQESARLFYVGMTRAKLRLHILYADNQTITTHTGYCFTRSVAPTPFLDTIFYFFKERYYSEADLHN